MMITKDLSYEKISALVERFKEQYDSYRDFSYNETQTRRDFIDPFFKALGWDVDNSAGNAEAYREVIHEDRVKIGKATKVHSAENVSFGNHLQNPNKKKSQTLLSTKLSQIEGRIGYCEGRIDEIVYELYGVTEEERKVIEGK